MKPIAVYSIKEVARSVSDRFTESFDGKSGTKLIGLLFGRPQSPIFKKYIYKDLKYLNYRSGISLDIYCLGWSNTKTVKVWDSPEFVGTKTSEPEWEFDDMSFIESCKIIKSETAWKYSGTTDLILLNAVFHEKNSSATLDYSKVICCQLETMEKIGAIDSIGTFFESLIDFTENYSGQDPVSSYSNKIGGTELIDAAKNFVTSLAPKAIDESFSKLEQFAVRDVSKKSRQDR